MLYPNDNEGQLVVQLFFIMMQSAGRAAAV